jgi:hypothetical protein
MAKLEPREATGRTGPVRTSSGTRVAVRLSPLAPGVASQTGANDVYPEQEGPPASARAEMPTRELDLEELRAMALRCASDFGAEEPDPSSPARPRLELILVEEQEEAPSARRGEIAADSVGKGRPRRSAGLAAAMVATALVVGVCAALAVYGAWP